MTMRLARAKVANRKICSSPELKAGFLQALLWDSPRNRPVRARRNLGRTARRESPAASTSRPKPIDFNWDVRPILSDNGLRCHGPDGKSRRAGLRLDDRESAYLQAIEPGKPEESEMIKRIISKDVRSCRSFLLYSADSMEADDAGSHCRSFRRLKRGLAHRDNLPSRLVRPDLKYGFTSEL